MLWKCYTQYASKCGKLSSGHRTGKGQFSFQSQRKAIPKNVQMTAQLHSSHTQSNAQNSPSQASTARELRTSRSSSRFLKGRGTRDQIDNSCWIIEKARELQKNIYFIDYAKASDCVDDNKLWKILKEMGIPDHVIYLLRSLYTGQDQQLKPDMEQQTGSKLAKEYVKTVYCHPAYLTYMQSTSWETLDWMKHKLESSLLGEK